MTVPYRGSPPPHFEGRFTTGSDALRAFSSASGPFVSYPTAVATPAGISDLQSLVAWASEEGLALIPRAAGTGMPAGNVGAGVVVDLSEGFRSVGSVDPARKRLRVGAGATASEVDRAARSHGLFLPSLPSSAERCTIGGMAANNSAGARSFKYGATRDWVECLDVVLADGRHLRLGGGDPRDSREGQECQESQGQEGQRQEGQSQEGQGQQGRTPEPFREVRNRLLPRWKALSEQWPDVKKNSSGYALDRFVPSGDPVQLLVGSEGTLGLIADVSLRLAPVPEARALALLSVGRSDELVEVVRAAGEAGASACEFFGRRFLTLAELDGDRRVGSLARNAYALLMVELDGTRSEVEDGLARIGSVADTLGSGLRVARTVEERTELWSVRHAASPVIARAAERGRVSMQFIEDSVVPPRLLPEYLRGLEQILQEAETDAVIFGHAGDGNVHVNPLVDVEHPGWRDRVGAILEGTVDLVARLGGTLSGEHGDGRVRAPFLTRIWPESAVRGFREVKNALDPQNVLNPGVILPLDGQDPLDGLVTGPPTAPRP